MADRVTVDTLDERTLTYRAALTAALDELLARDPNVVVFGEDIEDPMGGSYKVTLGLSTKYGRHRVRNTPISEAAIVGSGVGAAIVGARPIVELMFMDFITLAMDQLVNQAAFIRYMSGGQLSCPLIVRCQGGAGRSSGAQHSKSLEAWLCHVPGLKVVAPSTPQDAYWTLLAAYRVADPVVVFESNLLYRTQGRVDTCNPPSSFYGASQLRSGGDGVVVSWGRMVGVALDAADMVEKRSAASWSVVDLRWLSPIDFVSVQRLVAETGRIVVVHEAWETGGLGAEIVARVCQDVSHKLVSAPQRIGAKDCPHPFAPELEEAMVPNAERVAAVIEYTMGATR